MIKYIGSKRVLIPAISSWIQALQAEGSVVDLFSGTSRVGHALKRLGYAVTSNDLNTYAATLARCYVQADLETWAERAQREIDRLNQLPGAPGYVTRTFCEESRYFRPENGARIDAIRAGIAAAAHPPELEAVLLTSLMLAADRVDSTTGVQMAFLKKWAARAHRELELKLPELLPRAASGAGRAVQMDALDAAKVLTGDIGYLDPPYNQHKYIGNYHIWETLCRNDEPEAFGVARKRVDCRERKSPFNSRRGIHSAVQSVVADLDVRHLVVSFSDEGYLRRDELIDLLSTRGDVFVATHDHPRYVGARIGIHSPSGKRVGKVSHTANKEFLFIVPDRSAVDAVAAVANAAELQPAS